MKVISMNEIKEAVRTIFDVYDFEPVEDKPGYVWFSKRNFQIISIENLRKLLEDGRIRPLADREE